MKVREALRLLESDGWFVVRVKGSHRQLKHPSAMASSLWPVIPATTSRPELISILKQAGLK